MFSSLYYSSDVGYPCLQESDCVDTMPHSTCTGIDQSNKTCECTNGFQASRGDIVCTLVCEYLSTQNLLNALSPAINFAAFTP